MYLPVLVLDVFLTFVAFLGFDSTLLCVGYPSLNFHNFLAVLARFRSHLTSFFVLTERDLIGLKRAVLALDLHVSFGLVLFLVTFGYDLATLFAFVVNPGALHLVHAELATLNLLLAIFAELCFFSVYHFKILSSYLTKKLKYFKVHY